MTTLFRRLFLLLAALASAWAAGFFYTYSISVMPGLAVAEPASAIGAMQGINATVRTAIFAFAFFGTPVFILLAAATARRRTVILPLLAAAVIYAAGDLAPTFLLHVPMNEALATVKATSTEAAAIWRDYAGPWTAWNHLRAAAATATFALVGWAVVNEWR